MMHLYSEKVKKCFGEEFLSRIGFECNNEQTTELQKQSIALTNLSAGEYILQALNSNILSEPTDELVTQIVTHFKSNLFTLTETADEGLRQTIALSLNANINIERETANIRSESLKPGCTEEEEITKITQRSQREYAEALMTQGVFSKDFSEKALSNYIKIKLRNTCCVYIGTQKTDLNHYDEYCSKIYVRLKQSRLLLGATKQFLPDDFQHHFKDVLLSLQTIDNFNLSENKAFPVGKIINLCGDYENKINQVIPDAIAHIILADRKTYLNEISNAEWKVICRENKIGAWLCGTQGKMLSLYEKLSDIGLECKFGKIKRKELYALKIIDVDAALENMQLLLKKRETTPEDSQQNSENTLSI